MSVGLIVAVIVAIAVVLSFTVDNDDDRTDRLAAPAAPLSYYSDGSGEGLVGGEGQAVVPLPRMHPGDGQGEGLVNTADDLLVTGPATGNHPYTEEVGLTEGDVTLSADDLLVIGPTTRYHPYSGEIGLADGDVTLSYEEQARLANDEMLFKQWNDPLGWQATSEPQAVMSYEDMLYLEMNGVYDFERHLAAEPTQPAVDDYARTKFIEWNTNLPGWTDDTSHRSDRERFSMN